jgi:hypothetical protein
VKDQESNKTIVIEPSEISKRIRGPYINEPYINKRRNGFDDFKRTIENNPKYTGMSEEELSSLYAAEKRARVQVETVPKLKQTLLNVVDSVLSIAIMVGLIYWLYSSGASTIGSVLVIGSMVGYKLILVDGKRSKGGDWSSWGLMPVVFICFIAGWILV